MTRSPAALGLLLILLIGAQRPAAAAVAGEKVERTGDRLVVTWSDTAPVDVYLADSASAGVADARRVSAADRDGRFEIAPAPAARPYVLLKDTRDGAVTRVAERALPLVQGSNFRDLGGYPAADGRHVRWGRIYRSGATPLLTEADVAQVQALGLKDLVDLRSSEERALAPTRIEGVRYSAVGYSMSRISAQVGAPGDMTRLHNVYREFPTLLAPQLKILFRTLLAGEGAVAYNCSAGQDRTGFATAMVLSALGVPRATILADYHLSTTYRRPEFEMPKLDPALQPDNPAVAFFARFQGDPRARTPKPLYDAEGHALLEAAFAEVESRWGSVDAYLDKELGIGPADVARLRAMYLE